MGWGYVIKVDSTIIPNKGCIARINKKSARGILTLVINYPKQMFYTINKHKHKVIEEQICDYLTSSEQWFFPSTKFGGGGMLK